ncbi:MAG: DNA translocase FtsK [Leptospiraceae bacterium]|nr:DNA translocase FtsK [Leptospiraceae bacterium]
MAEPDINSNPPKASNPGFNEILGSLLILLGLLLTLAIVSYDNQAAMGLKPGTVENWTGTVGHYGAMLLFILFGKASYVLGPLMVYMGLRGLVQSRSEDYVPGMLGSLTMVTALALFFHFFTPMTYSDVQGTGPISGGGALGHRMGELLKFLFGTYGAFLVALAILVPGFLYTFRLPFPEFLNLTRSRLDRMKKGSQSGFHRLLFVLFPPPAQKNQESDEESANKAESMRTTGEAALEDWDRQAPGIGYTDYTNQEVTMKEPLWEKKQSSGRKPWIEKRVVEESEAPAKRSHSWNPGPMRRKHTGMDPLKESVLEMEHQRSVYGSAGKPSLHYPDGWPAEGEDQYEDLSSLESLEPLSSMEENGEPDGGRPIPGYFDNSGRSFHFQRKRSVPFRKEENGFLGVLDLEPGLRKREERPLRESTSGPAATLTLDPAQARAELLESREFVRPASVPDVAGEADERPLDSFDFESEQDIPPVHHNGETDLDAASGRESEQHAEAFDFAPDEAATYEQDDGDLEDEIDVAVQESANKAAPAEALSNNGKLGSAPRMQIADSDSEGTLASAAQIPRPAGQPISARIYEPESETLVPPIEGIRGYKLPLSILEFSRRPERNDVAREIEGVKERLEAVMRDYGIQASVVHATRGPMITQYEVRPEPGVRVNRLLRIQDEIRMHLAAHSVRLVAPIPGKSTIGVELPNKVRENVTLGDLARKDENFFARHRDLGIALGKDIAGSNLYVDLARLPHLLVAGATGSGKSVYMNSVIASILYNRSPEEVRFLMVDPKMVELKLYEGIPHLLYPVITDVRKASRALQWAVQEMERRYQILSKRKVRDIRTFNQRVSEGRIEHDPMPYVVVLIDELSDLMMVSAKDVEDSIIRLTQKARAVGIHLIMATQRPSVDVITALIKANCPARIAFQVAQKTDSRVILDSNGAESLLGKGDMLYKSPTAAAPVRIQSPMISEEEIEDIVREARKFGSPNFVELPGEDMESEGASEDVDSELLSEAWKIILESGKTSTSYVQRRLRIGYNRAANLIENLEHMGYLGPAIGNRPREILKRD